MKRRMLLKHINPISGILLIILCVVVSLSACSTAAESSETTAPPTTDVGQLPVAVTVPPTLLKDVELNPDTFDGRVFAEAIGYIDAELNEDGSLTITMTNAQRDEFVRQTIETLELSFASIVESESAPYIKAVTHNGDFTSIEVRVDRAEYEKHFDVTPLLLASLTSTYHTIAGTEFHVDVSVVDNNSGEVLKTFTYPAE